MSTDMLMNTTAHQAPTSLDGWTYRNPLEVPSLSFENIDAQWWRQLATNNREWALYAGLIYTVATFGFQRLMKNKPAFNLKMPIFLWNLSLGMLYTLAIMRTVPSLWKRLGQPNGVYATICTQKGMDIPTEFWCVLFFLTRPVEFGDTVFAVLKKRPVLVQWCHHLASMVHGWILAPIVEPHMIIWMILNYSVHSLLYSYLALRTIGCRLPKIFAHVVNVAECAQFVLIWMVSLTAVYYKQIGAECSMTVESVKVCTICTVAFLLVFGKVFYDSVFAEKKGRGWGSNGDLILMTGTTGEMGSSLEQKEKIG